MLDLNKIESIWQQNKSVEEAPINFEELKVQKVRESKDKLKSYFWLNVFTLITSFVLAIFSITFSIQYFENAPLFISSSILTIWFAYLFQGGVTQIKKQVSIDFSQGVVAVQKDLIDIHLSALILLRRSLLIIPFYFAFLLVIAESFFNIDLFAVGEPIWLISNLVLSLVFTVLTFFLYKRLQPEYIDNPLVKVLINGCGSQALDAARSLNDLKDITKK